MANYAVQKAKFGGMVGTIQLFSSQLPATNDPGDSTFRSLIPAGYLRCDGSILTKANYPALAEVLGTGTDSKFRKEGVTLTSDQFQLPDLGSKYISPGTATGTYTGLTLSDGTTKRVGAEFEAVSNIGTSATISYSGNFRVSGQNDALLGNPRYNSTTTRETEVTTLSDTDFQAHGHLANQTVLNCTGNYLVSSVSGPSSPGITGNECTPYAGNDVYTLSQQEGSTSTSSQHSHRITMPTTYNHNYRWTYNTFDVPAIGIETTINISLKPTETFDDAVSPFILVEYIIKH